MKRRDFIKTLPTIAAVPFSIIPIKAKPKSKHLIALGSSASRLVAKYGQRLPFDSFTLINDCIPDFCDLSVDFIPFFPPDEAYFTWGERRFLKKEKLPDIILPNEIKSHLEAKEGDLVLFSTLGKATGSILMKSIGDQYRNSTQGLQVVAIMPFEFEGLNLSANAKHALESIHRRGIRTRVLELEAIRAKYGNLAIRSAFEKADEWVLGRLQSLEK
jgi:hypothetical protein